MPGADIRIKDDALVLSGIIDSEHVPELVDRVRSLDDSRVRAFDAVDLARIDSAGLAFLVWCRKRFVLDGDELEIRNAPDQLTRLLSVSGLANLFPSRSK